MTAREKRLTRLKSRPRNFTFQELSSVLAGFGYRRVEGAGSRVRFEHERLPPIHLHKPHPKPIMKSYQLDQVLETLRESGLL